MEFNQALLTAVIGLITGATGSLIAPWIKWGIEKRRYKYENRKQIIRELKSIATDSNFDRTKFINAPSYISVRDQFSHHALKELERPLYELRGDVGHPVFDSDKKLVIREISALEKKWNIV